MSQATWGSVGFVFRCLFLLGVFGPYAFADSGSQPPPEHPYVTEYRSHLRNLDISLDYEELRESIQFLERLRTQELYETLALKIERLPDVYGTLNIPDLDKTILELLDFMRKIGSRDDTDMLKETLHWARAEMFSDEVIRDFHRTIASLRNVAQFDFPTLEEVNRDFYRAERRGQSIEPSRALTIAIDPRERAHRTALKEVESFLNYMRDRVVGQEPLLRSMEGLYLKDLLSGGQRRAPEVFYMMGLPGNGKDTIVEAYVDALYRTPGAHRDHLFRMNIRNKAEAWTYFGSAKGYVGSADVPDLIKFLVRHSGGRYVLVPEEDHNKVRLVVERNPDWKAGEEYLGPNRAVIFVNEAHNIPKEVKDNVLKQAIERGIFPINNPGSGANAVNTIELPVTFIFASNEGIDLLEPRQRNGMRSGDPLSYEELYDNYRRVHQDKALLKQAILKTNGGINDMRSPEAPGTSEEFLNRIPDHRLHILEPLSPEQLVRVARLMARDRMNELAQPQGKLGSYKVEISDALFEFIVNYRSIASENARPIKGRLDSFVFDAIYEAIRQGRIRPLGKEQKISVDVRTYQNGARAVVFQVEVDGETYQFSRLIRESLADIPKPPIPIERIQELTAMRARMLENVFGVEHIVDRLLEAAIVSEAESRNGGQSTRPATVMAFLGKSSTGKTETAKQYVMARYGEQARPVVIDFNGIRSLEAMEAKILGSYDGNRNPIPSEFMKQYDRANGNLAFIFDEAANSPRELLKALYEILREANPSNFTDGKARPMRNVTIILTGNAGEQIYEQVPRGLPREVRERAMHEVFRTFIRNEEMQHRLLMETFPEALLARIGKNIFHFGPLSDDGKRQIAQLKLLKGIESLLPKPSERGWRVGFQSQSDLDRIFEMIEREGFRLNEQGASIDKFVRESIIDRIKSRLLLEGVPSGSEVFIEVGEQKEVLDRGTRYLSRDLILTDGTGRRILIEVQTGQSQRAPNKTNLDRVLTAYHEAGHEIVSNVYFGDRTRATYLSVIEGVALIGKSFIAYNGVRAGEVLTETAFTKEVVLRQAAILAAGYVAQQLVTVGGRHDSGKSNDILRATTLIKEAILRDGLSTRWGMRAIPEGQSMSEYVANLSTDEKEFLNRLVNEWLADAERLAREAILLNYDRLFIDMSKAIAREGQLHAPDIEALYEKNGVVAERDGAHFQRRLAEVRQLTEQIDLMVARAGQKFQQRYTEDSFRMEKAGEAYDFLVNRGQGLLARFNPMKRSAWQSLDATLQAVVAARIGAHIATQSRDAVLLSPTLMPDRVANIDAIIAEERRLKTEPVTRREAFRISETSESVVSPRPEAGSSLSGGLMCRSVFM